MKALLSRSGQLTSDSRAKEQGQNEVFKDTSQTMSSYTAKGLITDAKAPSILDSVDELERVDRQHLQRSIRDANGRAICSNVA